MRVLAIDHGAARCGSAVSDPTGTIVRPLDPISPDATAAAELAGALGAELIVVGLPVSLDGAEGEQAQAARDFAAELADAVAIRVDTYDERLTTKLASASRLGGARASEDSLAAAHLLEDYLRSLQRT